MEQGNSPSELAKQAQQAYDANRFEPAAELFAQAAEAYLAGGNVLLAAEMRNNQSVALLKAGKAALALEATAGTAGIFAQAGDRRRQAMALGNQGAALEDLRRQKEALEIYQQAAELLKGAGEDEMRALLLKRISGLQLRANKPVAALFSMDAAAETSPRRSWSERLIRWLMAAIKKRAGIE